ncbi:zf-HC2 domain-containing protein [Actinacidiphila acidipaludis]|uniref:Zf-HC2 domain-containing protein n=1 Tax=Actinacidiphila acidipaludis TaxID=2873382 RepID=A0ABS7PZV9_9ACTN|nr:zf-HC2 domain-containing protein [Streptomyces acidipaludis]MBY8876415.1 zf-HC2 domain-containing protein [Streptomyces acidipaludis]
MTPHVDVGAYLLGALDDAEMTGFEEHLAGCEECGRALDELSGVLPVLEEARQDGFAFAEPPGGDAMLDRLLAQVAGERRRRRRRRLTAVAAAAVLVAGGPAIAVVATEASSGSPAAAPAFSADRVSASNPATGASAVVGVADKGWGTAVDLRLSGVRGPLTCSLIAVGQHGEQTVATWSVPAAGYGTGAQPAPLTVHGATGWHRSEISSWVVRTDGGQVLVRLPARA